MRSKYRLCLAVAVVCAFAGAGFGVAMAQNSGGTPAPVPSPSPAPSPSPPPPFSSPFGGPAQAGDSGESQAFNNLMDLYDALMDAHARREWAKLCGSASDFLDAVLAEDAAEKAFDEALTTYILDYSGVIYPKRGGVHQELNDRYDSDKKNVLDALQKRDKKQHPVGDCSTKPVFNAPPQPKEHPRVPPPEEPLPVDESGRISLPEMPDCFEDDSDRGNMIAGLEQGRRATADLAAAASIDEAVRDAADTPTCSDRRHSSFWDHFSIGVGVGVGGEGDHRHDDRGRVHDSPQPSHSGGDAPHD